ncbi:MAG: resE5 [Clostridia bacterium]|nr:resE5 [Clostridia bacterium]
MEGEFGIGDNEHVRILENMPEGYSCHKMVLDEDGKPIDFVYVDMNTSYECLTGYSRGEILGARFSDVLPELMNDGFDYIGTFGNVALTGKSYKFELYSKTLERWYSVSAFSDKYLHFSTIFLDITETKKLAIELQKANSLNEVLLDSIPHQALMVHKDRRVIAANRLAKEAGTIVGGVCWRDWGQCLFISEEDKQRMDTYKAGSDKTISCSFCRGDHALQNNKCVNIKEKLGGRFWDIYWVPTQEKDVYLHYAIDITEQKKTENDLSESELRFRQLAEASFEGICIHNKGVILDCNNRLELMFGYSTDELIGMPLSNIITTRIEEESAFATKDCYGINKDGAKLNIEILTREMPYKGIIAEVFVIRDISKVKSSEKIIEGIKKVLNESQGMAHTGNIEFDYIDNKMYWSDEVFRILGYQPQEFISDYNTFLKHIFLEDRESMVNQLSNATYFDSSFKQECRFRKLNGTEGWLSIKGDIGFNSKDLKPVRMVAIVHDITEKKQAELIYKSNEENLRLLSEAHELDRMKTEFFANVSHEFRTPINIIFSTLQLLEMYIKNGTIDHAQGNLGVKLKSMKQNCHRLLRLIDNLIDVTKIDSGFIELQPENVDIIRIIEEICSSVAEYTKSKNIDLKFDSSILKKVIACDPDKIERIMLNLLSNAVKFNNSGGVVTVKINSENENIMVSVEDNGEGIPKEKQEFIFDRFVQVDKSLSRNFEGSGIGLSLVKSFVDMHGGQIRLESEPGNGSKFMFTIPDRVIEAKDTEKSYNRNRQKGCSDFVELMHIEFSDIYI